MSVRRLADAAQRFVGEGGAAAIAMAALVSGYGYLSANVLHAPRITYALARQGDFAAFLGVVHSKYRTPYISIVVFGALGFIFAVGWGFKWNALLSAGLGVALYGAM